MNSAPTTFIVLVHEGRFVVARNMPGVSSGALDVVADCLTWRQAVRERDWQQAEHERLHGADLRDAALRGAYRSPYAKGQHA